MHSNDGVPVFFHQGKRFIRDHVRTASGKKIESEFPHPHLAWHRTSLEKNATVMIHNVTGWQQIDITQALAVQVVKGGVHLVNELENVVGKSVHVALFFFRG